MKNETPFKVDWNNIATELPPLPVTERGEGHQAPKESTNPQSR